MRSLQGCIDAALQKRESVTQQRADLRRAARKKVKTPELDAQLRELSSGLKVMIEQVRDLRRAAAERNDAFLDCLGAKERAAFDEALAKLAARAREFIERERSAQ